MDIARYIGLFLLKNKFAYIHGLGNLELTRKPAFHDGQSINAPECDVRLTHGGSIDDTLANFIATHEQTSISKAANALRDFATSSRADLAAGKEVILPSLGKFVEDSKGIRFITDPSLDYTPPPIPVLRAAKRLEEQPSFKYDQPLASTTDNSAGSISWGKIGLIILLIAALGTAVYFGWRFMNRAPKQTALPPVKTDTAKANVLPVILPAAHDTIRPDTLMAKPVTGAAQGNNAQLTTYVIGTYPTRIAAEKRLRQLIGNGNKVELRAKDSTTFFIVMPLENVSDTAKVRDSLRRVFNPKGVSIYNR